jgi:signal peptidase I
MKAFTTILNTLLVVVLLVVAGLFFATLAPLPGNIEAKIVQSGSMEPSIPVGALVVIKPFENYAVGQVITFGEDTRTKIPTTHRIESVRHEGGVTYYKTRGDANEEADSRETLHGEVIGRVVVSVPYVGFVLDFAREPLGFALLIGLPALIIIFDELFNIVAEVRKLRRAAPTSRSRVAGEKTVWPESVSARDTGDPRTFSSVQPGVAKNPNVFEDIRVVYTRRRVSDDMFVRRPLAQAGKAFLSAFALLGISGTLLLGNVGSTVSYFNDLERSLSNLLRAGVWGLDVPPPEPLLLTGNPSCGDFGLLEYKFDSPIAVGTSSASIPDVGTISIETFVVEGEPRVFDWESDFGIDAVLVKGGPNANHYTYPVEQIADTGLTAPLGAGPGGVLPFGISHISFCYDLDAAPALLQLQTLQVETLSEEPKPEDTLADPGDGQEEPAATTTGESTGATASSTPPEPQEVPKLNVTESGAEESAGEPTGKEPEPRGHSPMGEAEEPENDFPNQPGETPPVLEESAAE